MSPLDDRAFSDLVRQLAARIPARAPGWTDASDPDPGVTLVELLAWLADELTARAGTLPEPSRNRLAHIGQQLLALGGGAAGRGGRTPYATARRLSPADFEDEQDYQRHRPRRLDLGTQGIAIASGLHVQVEPDSPPGTQRIVVTPGLAITPAGQEINLRDALSCRVPNEDGERYVTLWYVDREMEPLPLAGDLDLATAPRLEEGYALTVERSAESGGLVLARVTREGSEWRVAAEAEG
jgi:hypothetical protein